MNDAATFLDPILNKLFRPRKPRKKQDPNYGRLYRWCKKMNTTYSRDCSYWDFSDDRIGTIGLSDGGDDYGTVLEIAKKRIETGNPEAQL
jgi:hypothetical protein